MSTNLHYCNVLSQPLTLFHEQNLKVFQARYLMMKYKIKFRTESNVMSALEQNSVLYYDKTNGELGGMPEKGHCVKMQEERKESWEETAGTSLTEIMQIQY